METLELLTRIAAPVETCFDLSLDIDLEIQAAADYRIKAISGKLSGRIGRGELRRMENEAVRLHRLSPQRNHGFQPADVF